MDKMYFDLVCNHRRTCNPDNESVKMVPEKHLLTVLMMLTEKGLDADGYPVQ